MSTPLFPVYVRYQNHGLLIEFSRGSFATFWLNNAEVCMILHGKRRRESSFPSLLVDPAAAARAKWNEARRNLIKSWRGGLLRVHSASAGRSGEDFFLKKRNHKSDSGLQRPGGKWRPGKKASLLQMKHFFEIIFPPQET